MTRIAGDEHRVTKERREALETRATMAGALAIMYRDALLRGDRQMIAAFQSNCKSLTRNPELLPLYGHLRAESHRAGSQRELTMGQRQKIDRIIRSDIEMLDDGTLERLSKVAGEIQKGEERAPSSEEVLQRISMGGNPPK